MTSKLQGKGTFKKVIPPPIILENKDVKEMPYPPPTLSSFSWEKKHHFVSINGESVESMAGTPVLELSERY